MEELKDISDLPEAQQKVLALILRIKTPTFKTSEVLIKVGKTSSGRSVGGILGSLYRNGYLEKISGGRDKSWKMSGEAEKLQENLKLQISGLKPYWR